MQLAQILLVLTALAVIGIEVTSFRLPLQIPTSLSSWLPFTFNVTKDPTGLGSVTLNVKPKLVGQVQTAKIKRDVPAGLPTVTEKNGRLNSKDSRLFSPLTERWELGIPSGAGLTAGSVASLAGIIWTIIAKNLEYKKEHGELVGKDPKDGGKMKEPTPIAQQPPPYGSYNIPSYSFDYRFPPHQKPEKGSDGFFKKFKGIKEMQAQAMKGFTRLVGLRDLNNLLHPGQKPKKLKLKKKPTQQQQDYQQPTYQTSYTSLQYPHQPNYEHSYAPPPEAPAYAPAPDYVPAPVYEQAPEPAYALAPEPAPVYVPEQAPVYAPAPEPAPVYAPPPVDVPAPPPNELPTQHSATDDFTNTVPMFAPPLWGIPHQARAQPWNDSSAPQPDVSSLELQEPKSETVPVAVFHSLPTQAPSTFISIQTNGFLPIFPSPVDPLPFMPSSTHEQTEQWPKPTGDVPSFGVAPSSLSSPPPRSSRFEESEPIDPTVFVSAMSDSQISEPLDDNEDDELTQSDAGGSLSPAEQWATPCVSENTTSM